MKILKKIADFYIFSNIHVAIATFFLVKLTLVPLGISNNHTAWFVFFSTLFSYNLIRFLRLENIIGWYKKWLTINKSFLTILMLISFIGIVYFGYSLNIKAILTLIPFGLATFLYATPTKKIQLRNIRGLKLFLIAFSWAGVTVLFPIIQENLIPRLEDYFTFILRFLFVVAITIPFDIRDMSIDQKNLKTIPQKYGIDQAKRFILFSCLLFIIVAFTIVSKEEFIVYLLISCIIILFTFKLNFIKNKYHTAFLIEALPIIWWLLYKIFV